MEDTFQALAKRIKKNKSKDPSQSYVAKLFDKGTAKIAQKVGEEGVEVAIAMVSGTKKELVGEGADLIFHLMVALENAGLSLEDVATELDKREGLSGLEEKRRRT